MNHTPQRPERLITVAIKRNGKIHDRGFRSHYQLRIAMNPDDAFPNETKSGDVDGFMTCCGRFVDRDDALKIAIEAGQVHASWKTATRKLLSSDVLW